MSTLPADPEVLCSPENVERDKLEEYARQAVKAFVPSLAAHPLCPSQLSLFNFSERKQSNLAAALLPGAAVGSDSPHTLVTRVGDALQVDMHAAHVLQGTLVGTLCMLLHARLSPCMPIPMHAYPPCTPIPMHAYPHMHAYLCAGALLARGLRHQPRLPTVLS